MINISKFGKGAILNIPDRRDYRFELVAGAIILPKEYSVKDKIFWIKNQNNSLSCVSQAFSYYAEILEQLETGKKTKLSARDIYSLVFMPQGGSYSRDNAQKLRESGVVEEEYAPSFENGNPPSEAFMRKRDDITPSEVEQGYTYMAKSYTTWDNSNFELYKQAIYQGNGAVIIAWGNNPCWQTGMLQVPEPSQCVWLHGVLATGWKIINGEEYLEFVNSWGSAWGENGFGYMPKRYIEKGLVANPTTLIDLSNDTYPKLQHQFFLLKEQALKLIEQVKQFLKGRKIN